MHKSFLILHRGLYGWCALLMSLLLTMLYVWHEPVGAANGGTWLGYLSGTIGAVLILWLLWFGVRKRQYLAGPGRMSDWLSAHVYLGLSLPLIAALHCGFQFGWNIHTLAYVLMVMVIVSGMFGVFTYVRYPALVTNNRRGMSGEAMLAEIESLDRESLELAARMGDNVHQLILRSIERTDLLGKARTDPVAVVGKALSETLQGLRKPDTKSSDAEQVIRSETMLTSLTLLTTLDNLGDDTGTDATIVRTARLALMRNEGQRLLDVVAAKKALVIQWQRDRRYQALMKGWLKVHIPVSIALLAALFTHVISVFYYW